MDEPTPPAPDRPGSAPGSEPLPGPAQYPHQELSEQVVRPGRSRAPWLIGAGVVVLVAVVATALWMLLDDDGESRREAYCAALSDVTNEGDLTGALEEADESTVTELRDVADLAPDAVADDWDTLVTLAQDPAAITDGSSVGALVDAFTALQAIASDAEDECNLTLDVPLR